jgi:hypothetical protein
MRIYVTFQEVCCSHHAYSLLISTSVLRFQKDTLAVRTVTRIKSSRFRILFLSIRVGSAPSRPARGASEESCILQPLVFLALDSGKAHKHNGEEGQSCRDDKHRLK